MLWREAVDEAMTAVRAAGVEIIRLDPAPFAERVEAMYDDYRDNPEIYALIQKIRGS